MTTPDTTRVSLLLRLRDRSDTLSWEEFHDRYSELLYRYARGRGAKHDDAEDVAQEVEMYVFKAMAGFEYDARKGRFRSYLRSAVVHAMARRASKESRQATALDPASFDYMTAERESQQDERWEREWQLHRLRWVVRQVAPEFEQTTLQAFQLHVLAGVYVDDTAAQLGMSKASIYQAKSRILKRVKARLEALDPEGDV